MYIKGKHKTILNHALWWMAFYFYEFTVFYTSFGRFGNIPLNLFYYSCNISLFYIHKFILSQTLGGGKKRYGRMLCLSIAELFIFLIIKMFADYYFIGFKISFTLLSKDLRQLAALDLYRSMFFLGLSSLYWTALNIGAFRKRALEAEVSNLKSLLENRQLKLQYREAQNIYLQQQINPHLLFNSLNSIHSAVYQSNLEAAETVSTLADIMRYSFQEPDPDGKKWLDKELEQIGNLISINRSRFSFDLDIRYTIEGNTKGYKIIPLVLMTLVENVFKHGDLNKTVSISVDVDASGTMIFITRNHKSSGSSFGKPNNVGLANIQKRLSYSYGDGYSLNFGESGGLFESSLIVTL